MLICDIIPSILFFLLLNLTLAFLPFLSFALFTGPAGSESGERGRGRGRKKERGEERGVPGHWHSCEAAAGAASISRALSACELLGCKQNNTFLSLQPSQGTKETSTFFLFFLLLSARSFSLSLSLAHHSECASASPLLTCEAAEVVNSTPHCSC